MLNDIQNISANGILQKFYFFHGSPLEQPILVEDNFLRQDIYESRNLTITQTVREVNASDAEAMNARNKPN
ncbi:hypothetical protein [Acinetobacter sp. ANC 3832]|uniref:hypothetical protein n=1 Tax=Acinetobacter sp. ANC 3832 TaxID=1977874 RepID=UPI000A33FA92|nr:hypothetical protein [Acinetobacter sp. ANC 3832]OTG92394.1 hypothetical protein B9T35_13795 [Acinetobacter sp. ANC 3832]